ncbi:ArsR/SmtB family transcription factor [Alteribacter natronophilus]|uniref:ArsR/SmtB family transcription factor n=1 Tax=Alteribacter natronophilus TaxID=2583810 RepID=UPI00110D3227|nr:metalloregulator ArsR/SmtB family transcription factor [Alteribacter natronophilus]TMW71525.1 winged helix-turn-helix transcriptional regulator [Alteribacter natronophilus]
MDIKHEELEEAAALFKLIGDKTRLKMLAILYRDECCVCELVDIFQMSQPSVSQHLKKLKLAGVVNERRSGQWIYYRLNSDHAGYGQLVSIIEQLPDMQPLLSELMASGKRVCCD